MSKDYLIGLSFLIVGFLLLMFSLLNIFIDKGDSSVFKIHISIDFEGS